MSMGANEEMRKQSIQLSLNESRKFSLVRDLMLRDMSQTALD